MAAVAAFPIAAALLLLVGLRWPAARAMPVVAVLTAASAWLLWRVPPRWLAAAVIEAVWVSASILLIVFGALFFLALLRSSGAIAILQRSFAGLSGDARIQAVLVGWVLGSFLEGAAGFGTPAAITAPLLIGLGFPPVQAVVVALVGDSTAVSFGAVGTPVIIGMGEGLGQRDPAISTDEIAQRIATLDLVLGTLMPAIVVMALVLSTEGKRGWRLGLAAVPFAVSVGLVQACTSWIVVTLLGPEFPSLIGPLAGLASAMLLLRAGWLLPRELWHIVRGEDAQARAEADRGVAPNDHHPPQVPDSAEERLPPPVAAFAPYLLLMTLLVLTRARALPIGSWLSTVGVASGNILETGLSARVQPLTSPGTVFIVCAGLSILWLPGGWRLLCPAALTAGGVTLKTAVALFTAITTVRIFLHSGVNAAGLDSMPLVLAEVLAQTFGQLWPAVAAWVGALGSFIAGSATFSNMLFALLQLEVATDLGYPPTSILALQGAGAAAGNMVCIHNVVAACAVAGILGEEGSVIRRTAIPMVVYLLITGALGLVL